MRGCDSGYTFEGNVVPKEFSDRSDVWCRKRGEPVMTPKEGQSGPLLKWARQLDHAFISPLPLLPGPGHQPPKGLPHFKKRKESTLAFCCPNV